MPGLFRKGLKGSGTGRRIWTTFKYADTALYRAKGQGRNRVEVELP